MPRMMALYASAMARWLLPTHLGRAIKCFRCLHRVHVLLTANDFYCDPSLSRCSSCKSPHDSLFAWVWLWQNSNHILCRHKQRHLWWQIKKTVHIYQNMFPMAKPVNSYLMPKRPCLAAATFPAVWLVNFPSPLVPVWPHDPGLLHPNKHKCYTVTFEDT